MTCLSVTHPVPLLLLQSLVCALSLSLSLSFCHLSPLFLFLLLCRLSLSLSPSLSCVTPPFPSLLLSLSLSISPPRFPSLAPSLPRSASRRRAISGPTWSPTSAGTQTETPAAPGATPWTPSLAGRPATSRTAPVTPDTHQQHTLNTHTFLWSQMAERWGSRASNQKVAGLIPCCAKWRCVLGKGTSPYLPRGECPCTYCESLWIRASAKWLNIKQRHVVTNVYCRIKLSYSIVFSSGTFQVSSRGFPQGWIL